MFVDGFNVIKQLHENHPDAFDVLKNFHVRFSDYGTDAFGEFAFGYSRPLIRYVLYDLVIFRKMDSICGSLGNSRESRVRWIEVEDRKSRVIGEGRERRGPG